MDYSKVAHREVTRRGFVGATVAGAFAAGVVPVARADEAPAAGATCQPSFMIPPEPVDEAAIASTVACDVLVIGCGIAGMSAARAAAEAGASVAVVEKSSSFNTRKGMGCQLGCVNSKFTRDLYTLDGAYMTSKLMEQMGQYPNQRLLRHWADHSGEDAEWFCSLVPEDRVRVVSGDDTPALKEIMAGAAEDELVIAVKSAEYRKSSTTETYPSGRYFEWGDNITVNFDPGSGFDLPMRLAQEYVEGQGGAFLFGHKALYLEKDGGRVVGAVAQDLLGGGCVRVTASKGVVVACGDISGDREMMEHYYGPYEFRVMNTYVDAAGEQTCNQGEGHKMCLWAGAAMEYGPFAPMAHGFDDFELIVDEHCVRAINEDLGRQELANWVVARNKRPAYGINGGVADGVESVEELAATFELDPEALAAAIEGYNALCAAGADTEYGKDASKLKGLEPPYSIKQCTTGAMLVMMGGIDCDEQCRALDDDSRPVEGLFVAGNTMGRRFNVEYPMCVNGISNGSAISFGRLAGTVCAQA